MENRNVVWTNDDALAICIFIKVVIIALLIYPIAHYAFYSSTEDSTLEDAPAFNQTQTVPSTNATSESTNKTVIRKIVQQPG